MNNVRGGRLGLARVVAAIGLAGIAFGQAPGGSLSLQELPLAKASPLDGLEIFTATAPWVLSWRGENPAKRPAYEELARQLDPCNGFSMKIYDEELDQLAELVRPKLLRYAAEHPRKIILLHFNGAQCRIMRVPEMAGFSPAHWLCYAGTTLTKDLAADAMEAEVANASPFAASNPDGARNDVVAIVPVDAQGAKRWDDAEYAPLQSIDGIRLKLLKRGQFRTQARAFPAGSYIAPLASKLGDGAYEDRDTWFRYNYNSNAPRDSRGCNGGDALVEFLRNGFAEGGPMERFHGVSFDVLGIKAGEAAPAEKGFDDEQPRAVRGGVARASKNRVVDADGDGRGDNGYGPDGENLRHLGVNEFLAKLRRVLGDQRIITIDGNGADWPRCPDLANGMESEGLSWHHDYYAAEWSGNFNRWPFWEANSRFGHKLNLLVDKLPDFPAETPQDKQDYENLKRLAKGTAAILQVICTGTGDTDEERNGEANTANWLGKPAGPMLRPALTSPDLLAGAGVSLSPEFVTAWKSSEARVVPDNGALRIESLAAKNGPSTEQMTISYPDIKLPEGDVLFRFLVKMDKFTNFPASVGRVVTVDLVGRREDPRRRKIGRPRMLEALAGPAGFTEACFYYREAGPAVATLTLTFEGRQDAWIKDFTMHNAADVIAREFENGAVLCNPSLKPYDFDLTKMFPGVQLRRILGTMKDAPDIRNDGAPLGVTVTLPPYSGRFFVKVKS